MNDTELKETETGMIPEEWTKISLKEIIDIKHGYAFKGEFFTDDETENVLLTPGNFTIGGGFKSDKLKFYNGEIPAEYVLSEGDIIITMTDLSKSGDTLGYSAKVPSIDKKRLLHNQRLGKVIFKKNSNIDGDFLNWLLRTREYRNHVLATASGTTVKHTSPTRILVYSFHCPSLPEQRAIASILCSLEDKIALNRQMNSTLEAIGQAFFRRWFVDFEFPDGEGKPYRSSGGEMVETELGEVPKGWRVGTLKEVIEITSGKRPNEKSDMKDSEFMVPLVGSSSVMGYVREILYNEKILIIGRVGTHGVVQRIMPPSFPSDNTLVIKSKLYEYIYQILKKIDYQSLNVGSTQPLITQSSIKNHLIIIPDEKIGMKFENTVSVLFNKVIANNQETDNLSQIRDALLPKLMSGEIRVRTNSNLNKENK